MARPYLIDLQDDPRQWSEGYAVSRAAVRLWDYFATITEHATAAWGGVESRVTAMPCRRRPGHRPCTGTIFVAIGKGGRLAWTCRECGDAGAAEHWEGTPFDLSGVEVPGRHGDEWLATILPQDEYRVLLERQWAFSPPVRRILTAARPTRPGIRIEAPRGAWDDLIGEIGGRALQRRRSRTGRLLIRTCGRLGDATYEWD